MELKSTRLDAMRIWAWQPGDKPTQEGSEIHQEQRKA